MMPECFDLRTQDGPPPRKRACVDGERGASSSSGGQGNSEEYSRYDARWEEWQGYDDYKGYGAQDDYISGGSKSYWSESHGWRKAARR